MKKSTIMGLATAAMLSGSALAEATFYSSIGFTDFEQQFDGSVYTDTSYMDLDLGGIFTLGNNDYFGISYRTSLSGEHDFNGQVSPKEDFERTDFAISYGGTAGENMFFSVGYQLGTTTMNGPGGYENETQSSGFFGSIGLGWTVGDSGQMSLHGGMAFMEASDKTNTGYNEDYDLSLGFSWGIKYTGYFSADSNTSWFVGYDGKYYTYDAAVELVPELEETINRLSFGVSF